MCDLPKNNFGQFGSYHENSGLSAPNSSPGDFAAKSNIKKSLFFVSILATVVRWSQLRHPLML